MIRVLSYNLLHSRASVELAGIVASDPHLDAMCLQEVHTTHVPQRIGHLILGSVTRANRLALAVYWNEERFEQLDAGTYELKKSLHDTVFERTPERLAGVHVRDRETDRDLVIASFHAAPLSARNSLRRKQISTAHSLLEELGDGAPILMAGDYNYPLFHNRLGERLNRTGYDLILSDKRTYSAFKLVRGHFDFVTGRGLRIESVETLKRGKSDHFPILITAEYEAGVAAEAISRSA